MLRHVDLCSGIGGFALGFQWAGLSVPVMFCDNDMFCQQVLAKHWPNVPISGDVEELSIAPDRFVPDCDIITAGYPCQPFSLAGKRKGEADDRHIWPFILKIVAQKRPTYCVFENVYGHVNLGLDKVLFDLEAQNYASRTFIVPACGVDAPHKRDRLWIIAHTDSQSEPDVTINEQWVARGAGAGAVGDAKREQRGTAEAGRLDVDGSVLDRSQRREKADTTKGSGADLPNADSEGLQRQPKPNGSRQKGRQQIGDEGLSRGASRFWEPEPAVGRVAHGIPNWVHRLRALGNAIVPQIAQQIGETIKAIHYGDHRSP